MDKKNKELTTTPPPASQERGGDREVLLYLMQQFDCETWECEQCGHSEDCKTMDSAEYLRSYLAASPPSSAAEASINPPEIDSKLIPDAAEQAKLVGYDAYRHSTHHVHRGPAQGYKEPESLPCYCTATMDHAIGHEDRAPRSQQWLEDASEDAQPVAEQAQAGEVCPFCGREGKHLGNEACQGLNNPTTFTLTNELPDLPEHAGTMEWTRQSGRLDIPELGYTADQMREYANACRLAGGVTVDYPMVHLALNAQPYLDKNDAMRVWQLFKDGVDSETAMRAALVAALGAK